MELIKIGEKIMTKPKGLDYELTTDKTYDLLYDRFSETVYLKENGNLSMPTKLYESDEDKKFQNIVINAFNTTTKSTTAALLSGVKGTGKSVTAKVIASKCNLPIIIVSNRVPGDSLTNFLSKLETPICLLFDEFEKEYDSEEFLGMLDGVKSTAKKLVLFTANTTNSLSEYLIDRCSRIRYHRKYTMDMNLAYIKEIATDKGIAKDKIESLVAFIMNVFVVTSLDNIMSFIDEVLSTNNYNFTEVIKFMNITTKSVALTTFPKKEESVEELTNTEEYDDLLDKYDEEDNDDEEQSGPFS